MTARVPLTSEAAAMVERLVDHYETLGRDGAITNLLRSLEAARERLRHAPGAGLPAPRPYPSLARPNRAWIKAGRYLFRYSMAEPVVILAVFYETSDIPRHF